MLPEEKAKIQRRFPKVFPFLNCQDHNLSSVALLLSNV
ncbi:hypothetical protein VPHK24_0019 [Vibrio phage K24]